MHWSITLRAIRSVGKERPRTLLNELAPAAQAAVTLFSGSNPPVPIQRFGSTSGATDLDLHGHDETFRFVVKTASFPDFIKHRRLS